MPVQLDTIDTIQWVGGSALREPSRWWVPLSRVTKATVAPYNFVEMADSVDETPIEIDICPWGYIRWQLDPAAVGSNWERSRSSGQMPQTRMRWRKRRHSSRQQCRLLLREKSVNSASATALDSFANLISFPNCDIAWKIKILYTYNRITDYFNFFNVIDVTSIFWITITRLVITSYY